MCGGKVGLITASCGQQGKTPTEAAVGVFPHPVQAAFMNLLAAHFDKPHKGEIHALLEEFKTACLIENTLHSATFCDGKHWG